MTTQEFIQQLSNTYVIYDKANDNPLQDCYGKIILFGVEDEAIEDCRGNEIVMPCTYLPQHWKDVLINQINTTDF